MKCLYLAAQGRIKLHIFTHTHLESLADILVSIGDDGYTEFKERTTKPARKKSKSIVEQKTEIPDHLETHCRVYFPTHETVASSRGGVDVS